MTASKTKRILVLDDEPDVTELLEYKLEQENLGWILIFNLFAVLMATCSLSADLVYLRVSLNRRGR